MYLGFIDVLKIDMQIAFGQQSENLGIRLVLELSSFVKLGKSINPLSLRLLICKVGGMTSVMQSSDNQLR